MVTILDTNTFPQCILEEATFLHSKFSTLCLVHGPPTGFTYPNFYLHDDKSQLTVFSTVD